MQGIVAILDTFVSSSPKRLAHVWAPLLFGVTYLVFNVIYTVSGGTDREGHPWIYPITDWLGNPGISCLFVLAVVVMVFVVHFGLWAVAKGRDKVWNITKAGERNGAEKKLAHMSTTYGATNQSNSQNIDIIA